VVNVIVAVTDDPDGVRAAIATRFKAVGDLPPTARSSTGAACSAPPKTVVAGQRTLGLVTQAANDT